MLIERVPHPYSDLQEGLSYASHRIALHASFSTSLLTSTPLLPITGLDAEFLCLIIRGNDCDLGGFVFGCKGSVSSWVLGESQVWVDTTTPSLFLADSPQTISHDAGSLSTITR